MTKPGKKSTRLYTISAGNVLFKWQSSRPGGPTIVEAWTNYTTKRDYGSRTELIHTFREFYYGPAHALKHMLESDEIKTYLE